MWVRKPCPTERQMAFREVSDWGEPLFFLPPDQLSHSLCTYSPSHTASVITPLSRRPNIGPLLSAEIMFLPPELSSKSIAWKQDGDRLCSHFIFNTMAGTLFIFNRRLFLDEWYSHRIQFFTFSFGPVLEHNYCCMAHISLFYYNRVITTSVETAQGKILILVERKRP